MNRRNALKIIFFKHDNISCNHEQACFHVVKTYKPQSKTGEIKNNKAWVNFVSLQRAVYLHRHTYFAV